MDFEAVSAAIEKLSRHYQRVLLTLGEKRMKTLLTQQCSKNEKGMIVAAYHSIMLCNAKGEKRKTPHDMCWDWSIRDRSRPAAWTKL